MKHIKITNYLYLYYNKFKMNLRGMNLTIKQV